MSTERKAAEIKDAIVKDKGQFVSAAEKWLRDMGVINDATAQAFLATLYHSIYWIKDFDITFDQNERKIDLVLKFSLVGYIFARKKVHKQVASQIAAEFFPHFTCQVAIKRA